MLLFQEEAMGALYTKHKLKAHLQKLLVLTRM